MLTSAAKTMLLVMTMDTSRTNAKRRLTNPAGSGEIVAIWIGRFPLDLAFAQLGFVGDRERHDSWHLE